MRLLAGILLSPFVLLSLAWAVAALWIDGPASRVAAGALAGGFALAALAIFVRVHPLGLSLLAYAGLFALVLLWWLSLTPSNDREWIADVARPAWAEFDASDGDRVTVHNVRNFDYRSETDWDERWETRTYDLSQIEGVDIFFSHWSGPTIAHTIMSWQFANSLPLAVSIETRKEVGEAYSAVLGFFRQFEVYYVVADERDVVRLRSNFRGEDVYLYQLTLPPEQARALLLDYLAQINRLAEQPRWYNAFSYNCTTGIRQHMAHIGGGARDWRILVNGRLPELGYERGTVNTSLPFEELKRRAAIGERARAAGDAPDFSARIRAGLPPRHGP